MQIKTKDLILTSLFTALTCIGSYIAIPLGPVPITLQTFFVIMSGIILGSKLGALSQITYLFIGLLGIPVFSGGTGGLTSVLKPSFGFILGFILAAYIIGKITEKNRNLKTIIFSVLLGNLIIYLIGIPYFYIIFSSFIGKSITLSKTLSYTLIPFIPGDLIKSFSLILLCNILLKKNYAIKSNNQIFSKKKRAL
ncbi:biotin transport system substrate-specific component [Clostridium cavendishii DSM 21758]|uniref:Biotin transporter n=1 Tax=Clostridium cavendishii DSM 21758 TaxID=1121302 RepID=A0A1M6VLI2_9CLOT|nr:biotin transporter BioY [Clostridium cavendishii]SHK82214.1 biotin transport system substrate-specific component [Clostridium cavendishii DSM 21758]